MLAALVLLGVVGACAGLSFLSQVRDAFNQVLLPLAAHILYGNLLHRPRASTIMMNHPPLPRNVYICIALTGMCCCIVAACEA